MCLELKDVQYCGLHDSLMSLNKTKYVLKTVSRYFTQVIVQ